MAKLNPAGLAELYRRALLDEVAPFWLKHSPDRDHGGYFTCLDRDGSVYDTDKFVWLQGRQAWMFATLYHQVEARPEWLDMARLGAEFLRDHGRDEAGAFHFSLTREGWPLTAPHSVFSDCFAVMAFAQYGIASKRAEFTDLALTTWRQLQGRIKNPKGKYAKAVPGTRPLDNFALPMILCNVALEMAPILDHAELDRIIDDCVHQVMDRFRDRETGLIFENICPDGSHSDSFEGRLINAGHGIEAMWFIMDIAERRHRPELIAPAVDSALAALERAWDREHGGIFYFLDAQGHPPLQLEWDQKLWWVHLESMVAMAMGFRLTGRPECRDWYLRVHDWAWEHFADPEYGEWFGYLNRRGEVLLPLKGGKWKCCFHVPRSFLRLWREFEKMSK